jgi:hypothetical protein
LTYRFNSVAFHEFFSFLEQFVNGRVGHNSKFTKTPARDAQE